MQRPSGLKYNKVKENPTSFRPGHTPWNKGLALPSPWNKGQKTGVIPPNAFKAGEKVGEANPKWLGDNVGYGALHAWIDRNKAKTGVCSKCRKDGSTEWSNVSHKYRRDVEDFRELCRQCHVTYDKRSGGWGVAKSIFPGYGARKA
jgi:hypothetical protein